MSFQWIGPDGELLGVKSTLTLDPLRGDSRGEYACQVTVGNGSDESVGCGVKYIGKHYKENNPITGPKLNV